MLFHPLATIAGLVAHDAPDANAPLKIGGVAVADISARVAVGVADRVNASYTPKGAAYVANAAKLNAADGASADMAKLLTENDETGAMQSYNFGLADDNGWDRLRTAMIAAPGIGALNVAPIGGDITLRASAAISTSSGAATAVDTLGWVKSFIAHLDVTAVRSGGSNNCHLDVYIQTQLPSGDWQDVVHFTQLDVTIAAEIADWGKGDGNISGIGVEAAAATFDRFFAEHDADNDLVEATTRFMTLGDSMRVKWVYDAGDSDTGDYTFALTITPHS